MGWTYGPRDKTTSHLDYFNSEFACDSKRRILAAKAVGNTVYAAMQITPETGKPYVLGLIILTKWKNKDPYANFGYKDMSEDMGPHECKCPKSVFDLLTPLEEIPDMTGLSLEWAMAWRGRVRTYHATPKSKPVKLNPGDVLVLSRSQVFSNGATETRLRVCGIKPLRFSGNYHQCYKLSTRFLANPDKIP